MRNGGRGRCGWAKAACALALAAAAYGGEYEDLFRQAAALSTQGNYALAIEKYQAALKLRPGAPEALSNLAVMYYSARRYQDALRTGSAVWKQHPEIGAASLVTGMAAVQCGRLEEAVAPLASLLEREPGNRDATLALASAYLGLGRLREAAALYEGQTARAPADADAWYGQAICYEKLAEEASRMLTHLPGGAYYSGRMLGEYLLSVGDARMAREAFGGAAEPGPEASAAKAAFENARALAGKSREAFERFVALEPDSWKAELFSADVERQRGNLPAALENYRKAAQAQAGNAAALLGMGTVYWEMGQFDEAEGKLKETLRLLPGCEQAVFELGNIAVRRGRYEEAVPLLKKYLASRADALAARADLGRAYLHMEHYEEAAAELSKAGGADERGDIHFQLAAALRKLGREKEAEAASRKAAGLRQAAHERDERMLTGH